MNEQIPEEIRDKVERYGLSRPESGPSVAEEIPQHEAGAKLDKGKPDASLLQLFPRALLEVSRVGTFGMAKYSRGGFLSVPNAVIRYGAAMLRHFFLEEVEGTYDQDPSCEEYGYKDEIRHDAQVAWNALARLETRLISEEQNAE